jgi:hypothetical protein
VGGGANEFPKRGLLAGLAELVTDLVEFVIFLTDFRFERSDFVSHGALCLSYERECSPLRPCGSGIVLWAGWLHKVSKDDNQEGGSRAFFCPKGSLLVFGDWGGCLQPDWSRTFSAT